MQYVNLGRTGLKVSRLCLGMMTSGSPPRRDAVVIATKVFFPMGDKPNTEDEVKLLEQPYVPHPVLGHS